MLDKNQQILNNQIAITYNCYIVGKFLLHRENEESKFRKIGRIYFNKKYNIYHVENNEKYHYEADEDIEVVLVRLLEGEGLI